MATGWLKGIHCKSSVLDDILYHPLPFDSTAAPRKKPPKPPSPSTSQSSSSSTSTSSSGKKGPLLPLGCGNSNRDVVPLFPRKSGARRGSNPHLHGQQQKQSRTAKHGKTKGGKGASQQRMVVNNLKSPSPVFSAPSSFPTLTELPRGHSSRQVVEIIFTSSWVEHQNQQPHHQQQPTFPGEIELLFRVHNPNSAVSRFEACRAAVRSRAGAADARCAADGNEMMRFRPAAAVPMAPSASSKAKDRDGKNAASPSVVFSASVCAGAGGVVRTFAGSGEAHQSGGGARGGRRAMLVCRVIAGRVRADEVADGSGRSGEGEFEYDSVAVGKGELLVFDPGAVLPCFLIIYKV